MSVQSSSPIGQLFPYPTGIMRRIVRLPLLGYRLGLGWLMGASGVLILTTRHRVNGTPRHTPIGYRRHGSRLYVVFGRLGQPQWYRNVREDPLVTVQCGSKTFAARARTVDNAGERLGVLNLYRRVAPFLYDLVLERMSAESNIDARRLPDITDKFTIVRLERQPQTALPLPPLPADLAWVLPAGLLGAAVTLTLVFITRVRRS